MDSARPLRADGFVQSPFRRYSRQRVQREREAERDEDELSVTSLCVWKIDAHSLLSAALLNLFALAMASSCAAKCVSAETQKSLEEPRSERVSSVGEGGLIRWREREIVFRHLWIYKYKDKKALKATGSNYSQMWWHHPVYIFSSTEDNECVLKRLSCTLWQINRP